MSDVEHNSPLPTTSNPAARTSSIWSRFGKYLYKTAMQIILIVAGGAIILFLLNIAAKWGSHSEAYIHMIAVASNVIWIAAVMGFPFIYVLLTGRFKDGVLWGWLLSWLLMLCISAFLPAMLIAHNRELKSFILNSFPEGTAFTLFLFMGWLPAFVICGIAFVIRALFQKYRTRAVAPSEADAC